jgi:redox-sensitive bicupin YhaK (pirin superfamily)
MSVSAKELEAVNMLAQKPIEARTRRIAYRTRGQGHGGIVRLMSPSDLGQVLKPFVFLDLFEADAGLIGSMPVHPHSGIATITVVTEGEFRFDDPDAGTGIIGYGGVEWMRAGGGVWHGQELSAGSSTKIRGYQLWMALSPELENGPVDSQYLEAESIPAAGPARVILGEYGGAFSPVRAPEGVTYLLVTLRAGERWDYAPKPGEEVTWISVSRGGLHVPEPVSAGELVAFEPGSGSITLRADEGAGAVFVLGSAVPHPHDLKLGYYSVHTSDEALRRGEARIADLGARLHAAGDRGRASGGVPVFR